MIPKDRLNATALQIQDLFYPLPNFGNPSVFQTANYRQIVTHPFDPNNYWTTRVDHRFSEKQFVYGRYTWQRQNNTDYDTNGNLPAIGRIYDQRNTRQILVSWTDLFTTQLVNEMRYGYAFTNEPRWGPLNGPDTVNQLRLKGLLPDLPDIPGIPNIAFSGLGLQTISQQVYRSPGFYNRAHFLQDHLSWFRGKHSIKSGVQITRYDANDVSQSSNLFGNLTFSNRFTGFPYADFLLGLPTTARRAGPALDSPFYRYSYDFFVTDEYKITPKLTLNLGVRYELHPYWSSGNDLSSVFDIKTGAIVVPDGSVNKINALLPANYVKVIPASQAGYSGTALLTTDKNNIAPRVGLAWRPWGEKTVVRAGFGIYYDVVPAYVSMAGVPFSISEPSYTNPTTNPTVILPVVFPNSVAGPTTVSLPSAFKKDLRIPYSIQYNITIERQIAKMGVRLSYIATGTRQGEYAYNYNSPIADTNLYINKPRPFPQYPNFNYITNGAGHQYNSLNLEVKRRFASGLLYDFSWVWARDIGDLEGGNVPSNTLEYQAPEYAYDLHRERAVWEDIPAHRVTGDFIYEMPFGRGKKWLSNGRLTNLVFGGWEISAVYAFNTGMFLTPLWTGPDPTGTFNTSNSTPAQVTIRPNANSNPNTGPQTVNAWFNVGAFSAPSPGTFGTSAKGVIIGPSSWVIDSQVAKNFAITERLRLRCELGATNLLNHPNWGNPNLNITSIGAAGVITSVGYGNGTTGGVGLDSSAQRALRLGLRVEW
ncbi:MAG TPA: TonB-dependent receptor [Bryobacteraceae bacterium]|nr:TonB-dependent receptor [Bryobacteraceae bacterium]